MTLWVQPESIIARVVGKGRQTRTDTIMLMDMVHDAVIKCFIIIIYM